jgi:hypothetical protein
LRKLCVLCVGLTLCLGIVGCEKKKVEMPKEQAPPVTAKPETAPTAPKMSVE